MAIARFCEVVQTIRVTSAQKPPEQTFVWVLSRRLASPGPDETARAAAATDRTIVLIVRTSLETRDGTVLDGDAAARRRSRAG